MAAAGAGAGWLLVAAVAALTGHAVFNARLLRRPTMTSTVDEHVAVLLPLRDEAGRVGPCLRALAAQEGVPRLEVIALDDGSTDGTADLVRSYGLRVEAGAPPPPGWLGKPHACHQLAALAPRATALVFVDADVVLAPHAVAAAVGELRASGVDLLCPYPRIVARTAGERLVQPLLQWSWLTFLPLRAMERSPRPSLAAAGGQFLVVDRAGYDRAGGHAGVRGEVLEDVALARAVKRSGGRIALADGSALATCRMYGSWGELVSGYTKSLWAAFGSPAGAAAVVVLLLLLYAAPPLLATVMPAAGLCAYLTGVLGRVVAARATGGRAWPDAVAHPVSIVLFAWLVVRSYRERRRGRLVWRGRRVP
ncbi:glycosyltransferase family 2 protein [Phytohabitans suffuscus]|uniref:glycosyltransferase n=1 Tax=Phytohabitans suffuscus TaxID=624315 RepID=UPI001E5E9D4C|nr:glycosyltransferase [Phytohabitans suffuscus]